MIKFIHKKNYVPSKNVRKIVITYSTSEIILGILLVGLTTFFVYNYLEFSYFGERTPAIIMSGTSNIPSSPIVHTVQKTMK